MNKLRRENTLPFVLTDSQCGIFTKENTILYFDEDKMQIKLIQYKYSGEVYEFYNTKIYANLKLD